MCNSLKWEKQVPNKEGHWLRVNVAGSVEHHKVFKDCLTDNKLTIYWGWSPRSKCLVESIMEKLKSFYWFGPIPAPDFEKFEEENDCNKCTYQGKCSGPEYIKKPCYRNLTTKKKE